MRTIRMLDEARDEFDAILDYVRDRHGVRTEEKVYNDILQRIAPLSTMSELGTLDTDLHYQGKPIRILHSKHTRIIYAVRESEIVIVMFWNNHRDDSVLKYLLSKR